MPKASPASSKPRKTPSARSSSLSRNQPSNVSCHTVLASIVDTTVAVLERQSPAARRRNAEAVHAMRVALTQARTALQFFAPLVSSSVEEHLDQEMRWLADRLGRARNADVVIARGHPTKTAKASWNAHRASQYERLIRTLSSRRYERMLTALAREAERAREPHSSKQELGAGFLWTRLNEWVRELGQQGKKLDKLNSKELHHLRVRAKRLRYAAEWCLPHMTPHQKKAGRKIRKLTKEIQQLLGDLADARMHRKSVKRLALPELEAITKLGEAKVRRRSLKTADDAFRRLRVTLAHRAA